MKLKKNLKRRNNEENNQVLLTALCTSCSLLHEYTTSSQVSLSSFVYTPLTLAVTSSRVSTIHQHHYDVDMVAERCVCLVTFVELPRDDGSYRRRSPETGQASSLQWRGGRIERMELRDEELHVSSVCARSSTVDRCRDSSDHPRHEHCGDQSHSRRGWSVTAAKKLFHVLVMNVRGPALAVIRGITDMNGALAWRALITRYAPNTAPRVQNLMSFFPQSSQLARSHWTNGKRTFASGNRFLETVSTCQ